jgi:hypothetical protein
MFPPLSAEQTTVVRQTLDRDLGAFPAVLNDGKPSTLGSKLSAADLDAPERERVLAFAASLKDGIERAKAGFPPGSPEAKALDANWQHLKMETNELLSAAPKLGLRGSELADTLIASLFSDGIKTGELRSVVAHDVYAAEAWTRMNERFFPEPQSADTKKRVEDIRLAILEHQGVPPALMAMFVGKEVRSELAKPENAALKSKLPNWEEKLVSLQKKLADPYAHLTDAREGNGRKIVALDAEETQLLRLVRGDDWHVPDPAHPDYKKSWGVVYADFRANYLTGDGAAKIVDAYRGWKTGNGMEDATADAGFLTVVGKLTQGPDGKQIVEGGSFGDGAKFFRDKSQVNAALVDRAGLIVKWNTAKADMAKAGGWLERKRLEFEKQYGKDGAENPFVYGSDGSIGLPYWDRPLSYPTDNRDPATVPEAAAALATLTPKQRAQLAFHLEIKAELARQLRALDAASVRGAPPSGGEAPKAPPPPKKGPLPPPTLPPKPVVKKPEPGITNEAVAFLKPLQNEVPYGGMAQAEAVKTPAKIAGIARQPLLRMDAGDLGTPLSLADNEVGSSCDVFVTNVNGQEMLVKVMSDPTPDAYKYKIFLGELAGAKIFSDLGVGPKIYGVVDLGDGRLAYAMGFVKGGKHVEDASPLIRDWTVKDLYTKLTALQAKGLDCHDFQYLIAPDGKVHFIDAAGIHNRNPARPTIDITAQLAQLRGASFGAVMTAAGSPTSSRFALDQGRWYGDVSDAQRQTARAMLDQMPEDRVVQVLQDSSGTVWLLESVRDADGGFAWAARPIDASGKAGTPLFEQFDKTGARIEAAAASRVSLPPSPVAPTGVTWGAKVTPEDHLRSIDNQLASHFTAGDISGVYADKRGQPILQADGTPFHHDQEMRGARRAVASAVKALKGAAQNRALKPEQRKFIEAAIARGEAALQGMDNVLNADVPRVK